MPSPYLQAVAGIKAAANLRDEWAAQVAIAEAVLAVAFELHRMNERAGRLDQSEGAQA